jgi:hypothetical protein
VPLTADHFDRVNAFLRNRIDPLLAHAREQGNSDLVTALTALSRAVESNYVIGRDLLTVELDAEHREATADARWDSLSTMAYEWRTHPDYLDEFELNIHELGGVLAPAQP